MRKVSNNILRIIATIPHPQIKISIFSWNDKFFIELEIGQFKQTYKIAQEHISGLEAVKAIITVDFINKCMSRFVEMRKDFSCSMDQLQKTNS
ncbi:MAG: hypothetical protein SH856_00855 [Flavobacteriales bacterium]|nr:hypothetical protein [Flavobacteriales bacterium]